MTELLTSGQMRTLEIAAMEAGEATGLELMERAGQGVCDALLAQWPELAKASHRAIVLCGPGNNGGDGFVIARLLAQGGWAVDLFLFGDPERLPADARVNHDLWAAGRPVQPWDLVAFQACARPDVIVDAVFGTGLTRPPPSEVAELLDRSSASHWKRASQIARVAVDCPSGLNLDTGTVPFEGDVSAPDFDPWLKTLNAADLTVTFHTPKLGHYLGLGPMLCGALETVDIGLRGEALERSPLMMPPDPERVRLVSPEFAGRALRRWPAGLISKMQHGGHKYDHGHVMVFAGGVGRGGAGRLAARAALRVGAGLVTVICPPAALQENAARLDAVMLRALPATAKVEDVADARVTAFLLGPGLGVTERTRELVLQCLERRAAEGRRRDPVVVLDADALTAFADDPKALFEAAHPRTLLTPHQGEFARLFPDLEAALRAGQSKTEIVRQAAARAGCVILLKGPDTVIAGPEGGCSVHAASYGRNVPWLATAGAGDVLAGLAAGLAAPQIAADLHNMTEVAVWLHVEAARTFGPGLIAEDLPEALPGVMGALGS